MSKTTNLSIRMDKDLKSEADKMFSELGMTLTTAITIFVRQALREKRMPFEIALRDDKREQVRQDAIKAVTKMRKEAKEKGLDKMTLDDINAEIKAARDECKAQVQCNE